MRRLAGIALAAVVLAALALALTGGLDGGRVVEETTIHMSTLIGDSGADGQ
jgi:hypothetical protein